VLAADGRSAGIVVELQSIESQPMREAVRAVLALLPAFERELGAELHVAGDPVWTVVSSDTLERDAVVLTALMFVVMGGLLFLLFRDVWFALLPVLAVGAVTAAVQGIAALAGLPMTSLLSALPPLMVVIAVATSIHLLTAVARTHERDPAARSRRGARGRTRLLLDHGHHRGRFDSFLWSDLESLPLALAALGVGIAFLVTFTLLPALLYLHLRRSSTRSRVRASALPDEILAAVRDTLRRYPRFVLAACLGGFALLATGVPRLHYASDFGFGEQSFVVRSLRAIEANFRKPMTTEVVVTLPPGAHVYDAASLALLARIESFFAAEPTTGDTRSFLDLLEDAHRIDHALAADFDELVANARARWRWWRPRRTRAGSGGKRSAMASASDPRFVDRACLMTPRRPRTSRGSALLTASRSRRGTRAHRVRGGLVLADRFISQLRDTQEELVSAFGMVAITLIGHRATARWLPGRSSQAPAGRRAAGSDGLGGIAPIREHDGRRDPDRDRRRRHHLSPATPMRVVRFDTRESSTGAADRG
jgi:hypothetical protein